MNWLRFVSARVGVLVGLSLALALPACGDDEGGTGGGTTSSTSGSGGAGGAGGSGSTTTSSSGGSGTGGGGGAGGSSKMSFFVSSTGSPTGNLGGRDGADQRCQDLAAAVGAGDRTWHAYLSIENGANGQPEHARDRIGQGPWYNAKGALLAENLAALHAREGDAEVFLDEHGAKVPGQWAGSPSPNQHDILTGSNADGTVVPGKTCADWTSEDAAVFGWVGHSDGLGPNMSADPMYRSWSSVHENGGCNDTGPKGGAGRVYCFAID